MPREDPRNIAFVCSKHSPKAGGFKDKPTKFFIGKFVKLAFPVDEVPGKRLPNFEHMWVKVLRIEGDELVGELDNDPMYVTKYKFKDRVTFKAPAVEEVMD